MEPHEAARFVTLIFRGTRFEDAAMPVPVLSELIAYEAIVDDTSPAYEPAKLDWLSKFLVALLDGFQLPRPYIYPMPDGLARAEWPGSKWEVRSNFDLDAQQADVMATRVDVDEQHGLTLPLTEPGAESRLGRFLHDHLAQPHAA